MIQDYFIVTFSHSEATVTSTSYVNILDNIFYSQSEELYSAVLSRKMVRHYDGALFYIHMLISISKTD
jgi:hypothetical protein